MNDIWPSITPCYPSSWVIPHVPKNFTLMVTNLQLLQQHLSNNCLDLLCKFEISSLYILFKYQILLILRVNPDGVSQDPHVSSTQEQNFLEEFLPCAFSCLPYCLLKASLSKGLAVFLENHRLPTNLQHHMYYDDSSEAIKAYILVCSFVLYTVFELILNFL